MASSSRSSAKPTAQKGGITILDLLTQRPPKLDNSRQGEGKNSTNSKWVKVDLANVSPWEDFTLPAIRAAYDHLLCLESPDDNDRRVHAEDMTESQCEIANEDAVDQLCLKWCEGVIKKSMKMFSAEIRTQLDLDQAEPSFQLRPRDLVGPMNESRRVRFKPDWFISSRDDSQDMIFVIGDSKLSSKWQSRWLRDSKARSAASDQLLWPLQQVATYCKHANTRYGFLFTPIELVAIRAHELPNDHAGIEYQPIPFKNWGKSDLTVLLSLWALIMMGVNDRERSFGNKRDYKPLTAWHRDADGASKKLVHALSGRKLKKKVLRKVLQDQLVILPAQGSPRAVDTSTTRLLTPPTPEPGSSPRRIARARSPLSKVKSAYNKDSDKYSPKDSDSAAGPSTPRKEPAIERSWSASLPNRSSADKYGTPPLPRLLTPNRDISDGSRPLSRFEKSYKLHRRSTADEQDDGLPFTRAEGSAGNTPAATTTGKDRGRPAKRPKS